jgi:acyl-CoA synthetase (AMP-forming)/AMP-acid ligase II
MLTTSGSTSGAKLVRLSRSNLTANARSIAEYLQLGPDERSIQSLPVHYAYGLSLVNSHLYAGGTVVLTNHSFMRREFWADFDRSQCTSFAGVPYMYELLHRLRIDPSSRATLRTMTQAGGGLRAELTAQYHRAALDQGKRFFVMYGQTEATARISYVPPHRLGDKIGSIGIAIPEGSMALETVEGATDLQQILYHGPNVMLGYASTPQDLASGDVQDGKLRTGDLGRVDDEGFFYLTGRLRRIAKVFGRRINLAEVEKEVEQQFPCRAAAVDLGNKIHLAIECLEEVQLAAIRSHVARFLSLRPVAVGVHELAQLPRTASRKIDYQAVQSTVAPPAISS